MGILLNPIVFSSGPSLWLYKREYMGKTSMLTIKCLEDQRKQEQQMILGNSHGAGGPQSSKSLDEKQVVCPSGPSPRA